MKNAPQLLLPHLGALQRPPYLQCTWTLSATAVVTGFVFIIKTNIPLGLWFSVGRRGSKLSIRDVVVLVTKKVSQVIITNLG